MGVVYEAEDGETGDRVAVKTLRSDDPEKLFFFKREFRSLQDVQHPNLASLGELVEREGSWFFTMELVDGSDFLTYVRGGLGSVDGEISPSEDTMRVERVMSRARPGSAFDETRLRDAAAQLATGLFALHSAGKIHRDVKPSNVLVTRTGRVVLVDFGLVATTDDGVDSRVRTVGTAAYMAPEQAVGSTVGPEADWYSFGVLLYEALTGELPYSGPTAFAVMMKKQQYSPRPPRALAKRAPVDLDELCVELLNVDPALRPPGDSILERLGVERRQTAPHAVYVSTSAFTQAERFVGRDVETATLLGAFDEVSQGYPRIVSVIGESGIGKTALQRHFVAQLEITFPDLVVLSGRCYEREAVPFKAFDGVVDTLSRFLRRVPARQALRYLPRNASLLPRVFPVLGRVEAIARAPASMVEVRDPHTLRSKAFTAMRELLERIAEWHPLLLVIDDLQWADADSYLLLGEVARGPDAPTMMLLLLSRPTPDGGPSARLAGATEVQELALKALEENAAAALVTEMVSMSGVALDVDPRAVARAAHRHPLFIAELTRYLASTGQTTTGDLKLEEAIAARVARLPPAARRLLELVAVAGVPLPREVFRAAMRAEAAQFSKLVGVLRVAQFAHTIGAKPNQTLAPLHNRIAETVRSGITAEQLRADHSRLAAALEEASLGATRPELLVRHLSGAGLTGKAAESARRAAMQAVDALAFDRAAELFATALEVEHYQGEERRSLLLAQGDALVNAGRGADAANAYLAAAKEATAAIRLDCERKAAEQLLMSGHIDRGLETLQSLLQQVGVSLPASARKALVSVLWNRTKLRLRGFGWKKRDPSEIPESSLRRVDVYRAVAQGLGMVDTVRGADFQARGLLLALKTGERIRVGRAFAHEAIYVASQGVKSMARAERLLDEARSIAERGDDPYLTAWVLAAEGTLAYFAGDWKRVVDRAVASADVFAHKTTGLWWEVNTMRLFHLFALRHLGNLKEFGQRYHEYLRDADQRGDRYTATTLRRYCHITYLAEDDAEAARAELERAEWVPPAGGFHLQHWYDLEGRAELALYEGRAGEAAKEMAGEFDALKRSLLTRVQIVRVLSMWLRARMLLGEAAETRQASTTEAAAKLSKRIGRDGARYGAVFSLLLDASIARQRGAKEKALLLLRQAAHDAAECDMSLYAAAAHYCAGSLEGGEDGEARQSAAAEQMLALGVRRPARMVELVISGLLERRE